MLAFDEALQRLLGRHPEAKPTGMAFSYDGNYYIELCDKSAQLPCVVFDGCFVVDGETGDSRACTIIEMMDIDSDGITRLDGINVE